jgi:dCMP deaminase
MRPSFVQLWMQVAELVSTRSVCKRLQVGCVITSHDNKLLWGLGYNGDASKETTECNTFSPGNCGHECHSEINALINYYGPKTTKVNLYCTHLPCLICAKYIVNFGTVKVVYYKNEYRTNDSLKLFQKNGVKVEKIS